VPVIRCNEDLKGVLEKDATLQQLNQNDDVRFVDGRRKRDLKQTKLCFVSQKKGPLTNKMEMLHEFRLTKLKW